jgi:hypothetical protein
MLKQIMFSVAVFLFISCEKEDNFQSGIFYPNQYNLVSSGVFTPTAGIAVTGKAEIYISSNSRKVALKDFSISNGPDLKVYLSKTAVPADFVNLGNLTSETVYPIPQETDLQQYRFVLIHCQANNHLFAIAELD